MGYYCQVRQFIARSMIALEICYFSFSAKGELSQGHAGRFTAISREAADIHPHMSHPVITIETENRKIVIKDYNGQTVALRCTHEES